MTVSVVVCTKNEEKFIKGCMECLKKQTVKPEIIIVDANSKDRTVAIAKNYTDKILKERKKGIGDARNLGAEKAKGDIVAYCDADSRPPENWVENIEKFMGKNIGIYGPIIPYDANTKTRFGLKVWGDIFMQISSKFKYPCICASNCAFKKKMLLRHPFKVDFIEDFELSTRIRKYGRVKFFRQLYMPISARRFKDSFHRKAFRFYLLNSIRLKLGREQKTYW
ncbi:MAG: glycosyltransferase family 2 protein [Candidatus Aenigmarchaeota archaeon]|nr:glycosyltransferase family 2 protein [Candidatus Aenigmarchaeota archaeon]